MDFVETVCVKYVGVNEMQQSSSNRILNRQIACEFPRQRFKQTSLIGGVGAKLLAAKQCFPK